MPAPGQRDEVTAPPPEIEAFLDQLVYERGLSENTRESYGNDLRQFWDFVAGRGIADVGGVSGSDIVAFLGHELPRPQRFQPDHHMSRRVPVG